MLDSQYENFMLFAFFLCVHDEFHFKAVHVYEADTLYSLFFLILKFIYQAVPQVFEIIVKRAGIVMAIFRISLSSLKEKLNIKRWV